MVDELEWQTRRDRINKKLKSLNPAWKIIKFVKSLVISNLNRQDFEELPKYKRLEDYVLDVKWKLKNILTQTLFLSFLLVS